MENTLVEEKALGMGAIVTHSGVTFRVWAPHAEKVSVFGSFNEWHESDSFLESEGNGYWAIHIDEAKEGDEYKFVIHTEKEKLYKNDPYAKKMSNSNGNSVIANLKFDWSDEGFQIPDWNKMVIYELHIGTFFRKEENQVGSFAEATERLKYIKALGLNVIELMPVSEFPGDQSWGYNLAYPFSVETDYGTPEDLANFINTAHSYGIAVIMDVVFNHFGPSDMDLWQFDGWSENDKGGIYFYNDDRAHTPWGETRPDYGRPEVRQYIKDYVLFWLDTYHCDGIRADATAFIRDRNGSIDDLGVIEDGARLMREINEEIQAKFPGKIAIAEDLQSEMMVTQPTEYGGLGFNAQWDSNFVHPVRDVLINTEDQYRNLQQIVSALEFKYGYSCFNRVIYSESHDEVANGKARVPEEINPGGADSDFAKKRAILGAVLTLTAPGIPMLFQGQEFLSDKYFNDAEELDWEKFSKFKGIAKLYKDLISFRTSNEAEFSGLQGDDIQFLHFNQNTKVLCYERIHQDHLHNKLIVVINLSNTNYENYEIGLNDEGYWKLIFNSTSSVYDEDFEGQEPTKGFDTVNENYDFSNYKGSFHLAPYTALIFTHKVEN